MFFLYIFCRTTGQPDNGHGFATAAAGGGTKLPHNSPSLPIEMPLARPRSFDSPARTTRTETEIDFPVGAPQTDSPPQPPTRLSTNNVEKPMVLLGCPRNMLKEKTMALLGCPPNMLKHHWFH